METVEEVVIFWLLEKTLGMSKQGFAVRFLQKAVLITAARGN